MTIAKRWIRCGIVLAAFAVVPWARADEPKPEAASESIALPAPSETGGMTLQEALWRRRSVREFKTTMLALREIAQLLWSAQGATGDGKRTAPSAGGLYPLELYVATPDGFGHYDPAAHRLEMLTHRDVRFVLRQAALDQPQLSDAPAVFVLAGVPERMLEHYGDRTERFMAIEAGHAAQNLLLEATALGLGGVPMGLFDDVRVAEALELPDEYEPLYLIAVGHTRAPFKTR